MENIVSSTLRFNDFEKLFDRGIKINGGWEQNIKEKRKIRIILTEPLKVMKHHLSTGFDLNGCSLAPDH